MEILSEISASTREPAACDICGKMYSNKANMKRHRIVHGDVKSFECPTCLKTFRRKDQLAMELLSEISASPREPAACDICGKMYSNKANMKRHRIVHGDVKSFECPTCLKTFHRKDQVQEHWMTHAKPGVKFDCAVLNCEETFECINHLRTHMEKGHMISTESPVTCKHCMTPYKTARRLLMHYHTRDLNIPNTGNKMDNTLDSVNDSRNPSPTSEGLMELVLNSIPVSEDTAQPPPTVSIETETNPIQLVPVKVEPIEPSQAVQVQPKRSRKRKAVKIDQDELFQSFIQQRLNEFVCQNFNWNLDAESLSIDEHTDVHSETNTDVTQSDFSDRGTPDSNVTDTATETSKCDESVDFEFNGKKSPEIKEEEQKLECTMCEIVYKDPTMLLMHMGFHTQNDPFSCNMCGVKCKDRLDFNSHLMFGDHSINKIISSGI